MTTLPTLDGPRLPPLSGRDPRQLVIFVHGYGSNGADLIGLAPYWQEALPDAVFVSPNAPEPCPGAPDGYQWWALMGPGGGRGEGVRKAAPVLNAFIDAELARYSLTDENLALVGFSQGTMMSLFVAPRREKAMAGVVGYSGMLIAPEALANEARVKPPILLVHGDADPMVPVTSIYQAKEALDANGFDVAAYVSPRIGHSIDPAGLRLGEQFLTKVFGA